jgi:hypothetical protein
MKKNCCKSCTDFSSKFSKYAQRTADRNASTVSSWNSFLRKSFWNGSRAGLPDGLFSNQKSQLGVKFWYILLPFGLFYGHWKYFMSIWFTLWSFGTFLPVLVFCTKKNLATLFQKATTWVVRLVQIKPSESTRHSGNRFSPNPNTNFLWKRFPDTWDILAPN